MYRIDNLAVLTASFLYRGRAAAGDLLGHPWPSLSVSTSHLAVLILFALATLPFLLRRFCIVAGLLPGISWFTLGLP